MSHHLENPHLARTPAGESFAYPSEPIPQNFPCCAAPHPYPGGHPTAANPNLVYEPQLVALGTNVTPLYPWRAHSDALKQVIRGLTLQVDSEVIEVRKEACGPNRSRVTVVFETPDEN